MSRPGSTSLGRLLVRAHLWRPEEIAETVSATMTPLGITITIYVVDTEQRVLRALPRPGVETPAPLPVDASVPGRAFALVRSIPAGGGQAEPVRWWVPMVDGTERMGVMDFVLPAGLDPLTRGVAGAV
jgi:hypothetical protein